MSVADLEVFREATEGLMSPTDSCFRREPGLSVTSVVVDLGCTEWCGLTERDKIKRLTMKRRKKEYFANKAA